MKIIKVTDVDGHDWFINPSNIAAIELDGTDIFIYILNDSVSIAVQNGTSIKTLLKKLQLV